MDSSRSQREDWLVGNKAPTGEAKPAQEPRAGDTAATDALSKRLDEDERALADLRVRLDAIESGRLVRKLTDELRIEIREWLTEELNRIAARLESGRPAGPPSPAPLSSELSTREREVLDDSDFLPYAERVEAQLREVEERVERAGRVVRDISAGQETPIRSTPPEPTPDDPGREAEESSVDEASVDEEIRTDPMGRALETLNRISFEQLRDFGLSVTQAARLLARRDARGSFASFDELNDLAGFSREVLHQLRKRLNLS